MNRHLKNKKFATKYRQNKRFLWIVVVVGMTLLLGAILFVYYPRSASNHTGFFSTYYTQIKAWMADRRGHLTKKASQPKHVLAKQHESEPQIHFEFYTALPNMQVNGGSPTLAEKIPHAPVSKTNMDVASADELEQELSHALKRVK
jgi:flagellar basal body-associated protein FliL